MQHHLNQLEGYLGHEIQRGGLSDVDLLQHIKVHYIPVPWIYDGHIPSLLGHLQQGFTRIDVSTVWETHWRVILMHSLP